MKRLLAAASLLALLFPASAFAQQDTQTTDKVTEMDLEGMEIGGETEGPAGEAIIIPPRGGTTGFLLIRKNFVPELLTSVNEL
jgi:hypothetical protein